MKNVNNVKSIIATMAILMGLPGLDMDSAWAAPAPRRSWNDPYPRRTAPKAPGHRRPKPRATTTPRPVPPRATPGATKPRATTATPAPVRVPPRATPRRTPTRNTSRPEPPSRAQTTLPTQQPVTPAPVTTYTTSSTLFRRHSTTPLRLWHLRFTAQTHSLLVRHTSLNPLKGDDLFSRGGLSGGIELNLVDRVVVSADLGWVGGRFTDTVFDTDTTEVVAHSLRAGAQVGYRLWDSVTPYVRGGFTATWLGARVRTDTQSLGGRDFAPGAYALAGVELTIRRSWIRRAFGLSNFTMGLVFEAGWVHLGQFNLDGGLDTTELVDDYRTALGKLTLRGVTINAGLLLSF